VHFRFILLSRNEEAEHILAQRFIRRRRDT